MPVSLEYWRASIGNYNCIKHKPTHPNVSDDESDLTPDKLIRILRDWIHIICSLILLFVQILFLLSFIAICSGPVLIICSLLSDDYNCTLHQLISGTVYVPLTIIAHFRRPIDATFLIIDILQCCFMLLIICSMLLMLAGDIEPNPGPKYGGKLSFAVWNLNSLLARDG